MPPHAPQKGPFIVVVRMGPSGTSARWAALALGCVLVAGGCSGAGDEPADDPAETTDAPAETAAPEQDAQDEQDEQAATEQDDAQDEEAADDATGECTVDAGTVNEIVDVGVEIALDDVNELANDGVSCIYKGADDDVDVIVAVSTGTWDGTDERVQGVVSQTEEYFGEPVANPDLGDQAVLFDDDFGGTSLVVFVDDMQYSTGISGAGWDGTPLDSLEERQAMVSELYEAASG